MHNDLFSSNSQNTNITLKLYVIIFFLYRYPGGTFIIQPAAPAGNVKRILCSDGLGLFCDKHCSISFPALEVNESFLIFVVSKHCLAVLKILYWPSLFGKMVEYSPRSFFGFLLTSTSSQSIKTWKMNSAIILTSHLVNNTYTLLPNGS